MAKKKAEPLDGWRLSRPAGSICALLGLLTSMIAIFGDMWGLSGAVQAMAMMPGIAGVILMVSQHVAIWHRLDNE